MSIFGSVVYCIYICTIKLFHANCIRLMKKKIFSLFVLLSLLGCASDDPDVDVPDKIGIWKMVIKQKGDISDFVYTAIIAGGNSSEGLYDESGQECGNTYSFSESDKYQEQKVFKTNERGYYLVYTSSAFSTIKNKQMSISVSVFYNEKLIKEESHTFLSKDEEIETEEFQVSATN